MDLNDYRSIPITYRNINNQPNNAQTLPNYATTTSYALSDSSYLYDYPYLNALRQINQSKNSNERLYSHPLYHVAHQPQHAQQNLAPTTKLNKMNSPPYLPNYFNQQQQSSSNALKEKSLNKQKPLAQSRLTQTTTVTDELQNVEESNHTTNNQFENNFDSNENSDPNNKLKLPHLAPREDHQSFKSFESPSSLPANLRSKSNERNFNRSEMNAYSDGRQTEMRKANPLKIPNIHDYLYMMSKKEEDRQAAGYVEQYKDIRRKREIWKLNDYSYKDFKQFKDNVGFGNDFLDPMGTREPTEQKIEKMAKRNVYGNYARERNQKKYNKNFKYDPEGFVADNNYYQLPSIKATMRNGKMPKKNTR